MNERNMTVNISGKQINIAKDNLSVLYNKLYKF